MYRLLDDDDYSDLSGNGAALIWGLVITRGNTAFLLKY